MQRFIVQMHGEHRLLVSKNYWKTIARNNIRILKRVLCILPTLLYISKTSPYSSKGILPQLIHLNDPEHIKKDLGNYLIGHFKYESDKGDYTGTDFESGRWFNRNLRIFRNIQRTPKSARRILVIFGAAHMNLLNYLFECSPEYKLLDVNDYLK